jgi:hypothetical protein
LDDYTAPSFPATPAGDESSAAIDGVAEVTFMEIASAFGSADRRRMAEPTARRPDRILAS